MNFGTHSNSYNSATQQQNMNTYTNGTYYQNPIQPYSQFPFPYQNNMPFPPFYPQTSTNNYSQNTMYNNCSQRTDTATAVSKREYKPLIVIDPSKNEVINLLEVSKTSKSNSLIREIKTPPNSFQNLFTSIVPKEGDNTELKEDILIKNVIPIMCAEEHSVCDKSECEVTNEDLESCDQNVDYDHSDSDNDEKYDINIKSFPESAKNILLDSNVNVPITLKQSHSIPNKLENLSNSIDHTKHDIISVSEDNLFDNNTSDDIAEFKNTDRSRLIYDRKTLLKISKSPLCKKPELDCSEIVEVHGSKTNLAIKLFNPSNTLIRTLNGYMPPHLRLEDECSRNTYLEKSRRNFKCVLNKIAPQNFDLCFTEIISLITKTDWKDVLVGDYMDCLIEEIFDKAVKEEAYSVTYADLCTKIVKYDDKHEMKWSFKLSLINRCKHMFETPLQEQLATVKLHWEKKAEEEKDEMLRNLYKSDIEEQVKKARDKYFGNIRFIGELFIHDLLKATIINTCVINLMSKRNEEDAVLLLCKLLETCGKKFDESHNDKMREYIHTMKEIAESDELSTRLKFKLFDIIEMSGRNWSLRKVQAQKMIQPKTLDEVKKDDLDEKMIEASKLSNKNQIRLNKKQNTNTSTELKFKSIQNKNQTLDFSSLQMPTNDTFELKPSYGLWASGSGSKDLEWQNVDNKRNNRYNRSSNRHSQFKSSPITSRDESPTKLEIGGRFSLLQQSDVDDNIVTKNDGLFLRNGVTESDHDGRNDPTSLPSTREQSPANLKYDKVTFLDGDAILEKFLDSNHLEINSWRNLKDVSQTIVIWLDTIMEKSKTTRNMVGDELASLIKSNTLTWEHLTDGVKKFCEDIEDLKTDIPLIWNFMAEFLERFIIDSESNIDFYNMIFKPSEPKEDVANCLAMCITYADERLGHNIIRNVYNRSCWSFNNFTEDIDSFISSKNLNFLYDDLLIDSKYFDRFRNDLILLLPYDDEEANKFLDANFTLEVIQTEQCVYFISSCVFSYISNLSNENIANFLNKKKLFFFRILNKRTEFEKQILQALKDSVYLFKDNGILTSVIYGLSDNILSNEAFEQFVQGQDECSINVDDINATVLADVIRSMLDTRSR